MCSLSEALVSTFLYKVGLELYDDPIGLLYHDGDKSKRLAASVHKLC